MKKIFASTFNRKIYYNFGGKRLIESYISTKQTTPLYVFVEGDLKVHTKGWPKHENITYLNLLEEDKKFSMFLKKYAHLQNTEPKDTNEKSEEFFSDAVRFSYKVFSQNAARKYGDKIFWVDSDCVFINKIESEWFDICLPDDVFVSFYNRPAQYTETGFIAFNNKTNVSEKFFNYYTNLYFSEEIFQMYPRTDCQAFERTRNNIINKINIKNHYKEKCLGDGKSGHIMARDNFINLYIDHRKGPRKFKVHSPEIYTKHLAINNLFFQAINFEKNGDLIMAKLNYEKIIKINSELPNAYYNLGNILKDLGEFEKAINCYEKVIKIDPKNISAINNLGVLHRNAKNFQKAIYYFENIIKINNRYFGAYINLGNILKDLGEFEKAINCYEKVIKIDPKNISAINNLGVLYREIKEYQKAIIYFNQTIKINPNLLVSYLNLGYAFLGLEDLVNAELFFKKAILLNPKNTDSHFSLMEFLEKSNNVEKLKAAIITAKKLLKNNPIIAIFQTLLLFRKDNYIEAKSLLESIDIEKYKNISLDQKIKFYELLATTYDKINETKKSFKYFTIINQYDSKKNINKKYDKEKILKEIDKNIKYFVPNNISKWEKRNMSINASEFSPVFLVGFPRSGTTLIDSILRGHPLIEILEEKPMIEKMNFYFYDSLKGKQENLKNIDNAQIKRLRKTYFDVAKKYLSVSEKNNKMIIDKLPLNIKDVGFIHRVFPESKFIFVLRHPCDSVLSCFMNRFGANNAMINFYTLSDTANLYNKIMLLWKQYITVLPIHYSTIKYENIIENIETSIKPLINFINLDWDKSVLSYKSTAQKRIIINTPSYNQVIKKVYKESSGRWKRYKNEIKLVYPILEKWIKEFDY